MRIPHQFCFLGYITESGQVKAHPEKIRAVAEWPRPSTRKQLQRFLGFAKFCLCFIQECSKVAASLTKLTSPSIQFSWTPEAERAFSELKSLFISAPLLVQPDLSCQFIIEMDASDTGIGAVFSQSSMPDHNSIPMPSFRDISISTQLRCWQQGAVSCQVGIRGLETLAGGSRTTVHT